ncbi:hypothetical protein [Pseudogulbenkiania subflava]|uniref:Uncharacterized protein n=1 Tax=Pseudogulbenkiania subflava DSM 22618 TaxID=1123014 RepID=A0A1Y6BGH5_9NEIS|nr:hypothetical protein [Pseudogulbenkiania subflava]SMF02088.1 hypothetical protein SAMN02745746_00772 [Pseudogulbenkiania subflava DSM 22618]
MAKNAIEAGQIVSRHIERPKLVELEARKRGELAAQIHQTTHITVDGAADPRATASAISDAQRGVNNDIVRNYKTTAR